MSALKEVLRFFFRTALWTCAGAGAGLLVAAAAPIAVGHRSFTVMSGSMEPAVSTGDIVTNRRIAPRAARVGDVVTFSDPRGTGKLISHRVRKVRAEGGKLEFTTKGDANNTHERWSVAADGTIGRAVYRVRKLGHVMVLTRTPAGRIGLLAVPALLLGGWALVAIWRPRENGVSDAPAG